MRKNFKRLLSIFLIFALVLGMGVTVFADSSRASKAFTVNFTFNPNYANANDWELKCTVKKNNGSKDFSNLELTITPGYLNGATESYSGKITPSDETPFNLILEEGDVPETYSKTLENIKFNYNGITTCTPLYKYVLTYYDSFTEKDEYIEGSFNPTIIPNLKWGVGKGTDLTTNTPYTDKSTLSHHCRKHMNDEYPDGVTITTVVQYYNQAMAFKRQVQNDYNTDTSKDHADFSISILLAVKFITNILQEQIKDLF